MLDNGTGPHQFRECECGPHAFLIPELAAISVLNPQLASIEYVIDALSDILIGEPNGHMLIICYVNYLLSIGGA